MQVILMELFIWTNSFTLELSVYVVLKIDDWVNGISAYILQLHSPFLLDYIILLITYWMLFLINGTIKNMPLSQQIYIFMLSNQKFLLQLSHTYTHFHFWVSVYEILLPIKWNKFLSIFHSQYTFLPHLYLFTI